jgi:hypothetical protein
VAVRPSDRFSLTGRESALRKPESKKSLPGWRGRRRNYRKSGKSSPGDVTAWWERRGESGDCHYDATRDRDGERKKTSFGKYGESDSISQTFGDDVSRYRTEKAKRQ